MNMAFLFNDDDGVPEGITSYDIYIESDSDRARITISNPDIEIITEIRRGGDKRAVLSTVANYGQILGVAVEKINEGEGNE